MTTPSSSTILDSYILFELDKISLGSFKRRITNELVEFVKSGAYIHVEYQENFIQFNRSTIIITILPNTSDIIYHFTISNEYPFKPPIKFSVNYKDYKKYLKIDSQKTLNELRVYNKIQCLCCNTISCGEHWSPSLKMQHFIDEFNKIKKYRRNIINRLLTVKIINKYLISDINIIQWLL